MPTALLALLLVTGPVLAQVGAPPIEEIALDVDSGWVEAPRTGRATVWATVVADESAAWLRLRFGTVELGAAPDGAPATTLRITGLREGAVHELDAYGAALWRNTSAYLNGDALLVEIVASAGAAPSRVRIDGAWMQDAGEGPAVSSLCGADDRTLSTDPEMGRTMPLGCTTFMIDDENHSFLTAGHCGDLSDLDVVQFNVPLSLPNGAYQNPGPQDQYVVDETSVQRNPGSPSLGSDWTYFGCFPNTLTGLKPYQAQGSWFATSAPPPASGQLRIAGYGTNTAPLPLTWNGVQKVGVGGYTAFGGYVVQHTVDTTGGNSGSPVQLAVTGEVIAIHTNGGCDTIGVNYAQGLNRPELLNAIANPQGVCRLLPELAFAHPDGVPSLVLTDGQLTTMTVSGINYGTPLTGTGMLHVNDGGGWVAVPMTHVGGGAYFGTFPSLACDVDVSFYYSAATVGGDVHTDPPAGPDAPYVARTASSIAIVVNDDFEADSGWTVVNDANLTDGPWDRGVPVGGGDRGDPPIDGDGSGACWLTDNVDGNSDVDGGTTTLVSPVLDASDPDAVVGYWRWYNNVGGGDPENDVFVVQVSDDGGASWLDLEVVGPSGPEVAGGWYRRVFRLADVPGFAPSSQFRIRFACSDLGTGSLVEAGVDGFLLAAASCDAPLPGDATGDGLVDFADLLAVLSAWGPCGDPGNCPEDFDGSGTVDFNDLLVVLANWS